MAKEEYVELRRDEAAKACASLGIEDLEFWSYEDRSLAGSRGAIRQVIDLLNDFRPGLVYCPSPLEIHPDHRAACFLVCDAINSCDREFEVAFYEVNQPLSVNTLVDITRVMDRKREALNAYESQLKERPYDDISLSLNRYRSMTLPEGATYAEGFSLWQTEIIRKIGPLSIPFHRIERLAPASGEAGPLVSVIVRTKDRPSLLANALRSIVQQTYANLEIVVVNDGGQDVREVVNALAGNIPVLYVQHEKNKGRSAAANSGLKAAHGSYLNFLDDDDLFYPDHVETLLSHLQAGEEKVAYSNVLNVYFNGPSHRSENRSKEELVFNFDFDPDRLLFENYIPLMSVLFSRDVLSQVEGFSRDLILFEDWDFWIRVSRHFSFHHIDKVTAEYRFYGHTDMEESHRKKYRYDEAKAMIFDRALPFLKGKAWVNFLNRGWVETLRREAWAKGKSVAELEDETKRYQATLLEKEKELGNVKGQYDELLALNKGLENNYVECSILLERLEKNPALRAYRKLRQMGSFLKKI